MRRSKNFDKVKRYSNGVRPDSLPNQQRRRHCPFRRDK